MKGWGILVPQAISCLLMGASDQSNHLALCCGSVISLDMTLLFIWLSNCLSWLSPMLRPTACCSWHVLLVRFCTRQKCEDVSWFGTENLLIILFLICWYKMMCLSQWTLTGEKGKSPTSFLDLYCPRTQEGPGRESISVWCLWLQSLLQWQPWDPHKTFHIKSSENYCH